jgi:hypothetical protein
MKSMEPHWLTDLEMKSLEPAQSNPQHTPVLKCGGLYYFSDEVWSYLFGPFQKESEAVESLNKYAESLH